MAHHRSADDVYNGSLVRTPISSDFICGKNYIQSYTVGSSNNKVELG